MEDRYLFRGKTISGEWVQGLLATENNRWYISNKAGRPFAYEIIPETICQCTGLKDKNGNLIWENDILMSHGNPKDLVKVVFGEFTVIDVSSLEKIDRVIGWHYEVITTDGLSKLEPFCLSMPITENYVKWCEFEVVGNVFDNPELLEV